MSNTIDENKYKNAILYFVKECNNIFLGKTKLNKLLYYLDFISYRDRQKSVTGDVYICQMYGPVPKKLYLIKKKMDGKDFLIKQENMKIENDGTETFREFYETIPNKTFNLNIFDKYEQALLESIVREFKEYPTPKIVTQTHFEAPWFFAKKNDVVDYNYASDIEFFEKLQQKTA